MGPVALEYLGLLDTVVECIERTRRVRLHADRVKALFGSFSTGVRPLFLTAPKVSRRAVRHRPRAPITRPRAAHLPLSQLGEWVKTTHIGGPTIYFSVFSKEQIDPSFVVTHRVSLEDGPQMYETFLRRK
ncbi:hypothetical protein LMG28138_05254 [Pararobbsia alpina]|uniref:Uncharacterized protein n=1 Tax=Pararobbsia alpina TaxID=621374 RepID=A0A6S7BU74_9BURK|nr:hypothetical protein LMG28138_05254 [Pararobbsia alpina]